MSHIRFRRRSCWRPTHSSFLAYAGIQDRRAVVKWSDYHRLQEVLELLRFLGELEWVALLRVRVDVCKVVAIACSGI